MPMSKTKTQKVKVKRAKWQPGDPRVKSGHWTSKYKPEFDDIASRLIGTGFNEQDLAHTFDVPASAIKGWKRSFPSFKKACNDGKKGQLKRLASNSLREAMGYDWVGEKTITKYNQDGTVQEVVEHKIPMHQAGNATLATFMMCNLSNQLKLDDDEAYKAKQKVEVENKNLNVNITAELVGEQIDRLAGKLLGGGAKQIESEVID
jgi:hypothetical protein